MALTGHIVKAIRFLREAKGSTLKDILEYVKKNPDKVGGGIKGNLGIRLRKALDLAMKNGVVSSKSRRYYLCLNEKSGKPETDACGKRRRSCKRRRSSCRRKRRRSCRRRRRRSCTRKRRRSCTRKRRRSCTRKRRRSCTRKRRRSCTRKRRRSCTRKRRRSCTRRRRRSCPPKKRRCRRSRSRCKSKTASICSILSQCKKKKRRCRKSKSPCSIVDQILKSRNKSQRKPEGMGGSGQSDAAKEGEDSQQLKREVGELENGSAE